MRHYHRGRNCRPYDADWDRDRDRRDRHCHRDVERHYVPEVGRRVWHYHKGKNCRPIAADRDDRRDRHCHRDGQRHYHDRWGRVVHRHVGPNCRVDLFRMHRGPWSDDCVMFGPIRFCP
jgi:hypothetical protein